MSRAEQPSHDERTKRSDVRDGGSGAERRLQAAHGTSDRPPLPPCPLPLTIHSDLDLPLRCIDRRDGGHGQQQHEQRQQRRAAHGDGSGGQRHAEKRVDTQAQSSERAVLATAVPDADPLLRAVAAGCWLWTDDERCDKGKGKKSPTNVPTVRSNQTRRPASARSPSNATHSQKQITDVNEHSLLHSHFLMC